MSFFDNIFDGIIGAGVSAVGNIFGASLQNTANRAISADTTAFNKAEAQRNRKFQERMSSTAYQRSMADMKKAGLNPILAYKSGGASSPGGSTATGAQIPAQNVLSGAVSSAMAAKRLRQDLKLMDAQIGKTEQEQQTSAMQFLKLLEETSIANSAAKVAKIKAFYEENLLNTSIGKTAYIVGLGAKYANPFLSQVKPRR